MHMSAYDPKRACCHKIWICALRQSYFSSYLATAFFESLTSQNYTLRNIARTIAADERRQATSQVTSSCNVVMQLPPRLQIDSMLLKIGRRAGTSQPAFPGAQSTEVNNGKGDDADD